MTDVIGMLVSVTVIGVVAVLAIGNRHAGKKEFNRQFEGAFFDTSAGRLRGSDLCVAKYVFQELNGGEGGRGLRTGWWYCVTLGPNWLLVIGQDDLVGARIETTWVVRDLSEERMRGALAGDAEAARVAFGHSTGDAI